MKWRWCLGLLGNGLDQSEAPDEVAVRGGEVEGRCSQQAAWSPPGHTHKQQPGRHTTHRQYLLGRVPAVQKEVQSEHLVDQERVHPDQLRHQRQQRRVVGATGGLSGEAEELKCGVAQQGPPGGITSEWPCMELKRIAWDAWQGKGRLLYPLHYIRSKLLILSHTVHAAVYTPFISSLMPASPLKVKQIHTDGAACSARRIAPHEARH